MKIQLLSAATATNSAPTAGTATVGFPLKGAAFTGQAHGVPNAGEAALSLKSTAGSGTMTVTIKIWVWVDAMSEWVPLGSHATASLKGVINEGNAIGEVAANSLLHTELVSGLQHFGRIYAEITAIGGTSTAVDLWVHGAY